jgi:Site-specific recombinases, DNA invertase Pin homologs
MRTVLYCRVSTADRGQTIETQLHALREFCNARGWTIVKEYSDVGVSGSKESRPQLDLLMRDAKRRKFDCVAVFRLDRFGRSTRHLLNAVAEFEALQIAFVSLSDSWDTSTPAGRLLFTVVAAMAEFERSILMERVNAGIKRAQAQGKHCGRPKGSGAAVIDLASVRQQIAGGTSLRSVAKSFAVSPSLLCKRLREVTA